MRKSATPFVATVALLAGGVLVGCASPGGSTLVAGGQASFDGTISAIDLQPWTYDGNAVIKVETATHGEVSVQLPARWNLCQAQQVDAQALAVGMRVQVAGEVAEEGQVVVCSKATHRLVPAGQPAT